MRVLHIATRFLRGGSERDIAFSINRERSLGFDVHLAAGEIDPTDVPEGLELHEVPHLVRAISPIRDVAAIAEIKRLWQRGAYDVVVTHQSKAGVLGRIALASSPVTRCHVVHMASFGPGYPAAASAVFRYAERYCGRSTDVFASVSSELRERYLDAGVARDASRFLVVRTPIDLATLLALRTSGENDRARARRRLGLPDSKAIVGIVGALEPRKRHHLALHALRESLLRGDFVVAIAGDGPERMQLQRLSQELGVADRVAFLGRVERVEDVFLAADVIFHCSVTEGMPRVVIEALASGTPVVATDAEGLREVDGAPIRILPSSGAGAPAAVAEAIGMPSAAVAPSRLQQWSTEAVEKQVDVFWSLVIRLRFSESRGTVR